MTGCHDVAAGGLAFRDVNVCGGEGKTSQSINLRRSVLNQLCINPLMLCIHTGWRAVSCVCLRVASVSKLLWCVLCVCVRRVVTERDVSNVQSQGVSI